MSNYYDDEDGGGGDAAAADDDSNIVQQPLHVVAGHGASRRSQISLMIIRFDDIYYVTRMSQLQSSSKANLPDHHKIPRALFLIFLWMLDLDCVHKAAQAQGSVMLRGTTRLGMCSR